MKHFFLAPLFAVLFLAGCMPKALVTCAPDSPDLHAKGDGNISFQGNGDHLESQLAFSPANHLGLMANAYSSLWHGRTNCWQGAVGYYLHEHRFGFDVYAGYGTGERHRSQTYTFMASESFSDASVDASFYHYFLQSDVYFNPGEKNTLALNVQFTRFYLYDFSFEDHQLPAKWDWRTFTYRLNSPNQDMFNIAFMLRHRVNDYLQLFIQPGFQTVFPSTAEVIESNHESPYFPNMYTWHDGSDFMKKQMTRYYLNSGIVFNVPGLAAVFKSRKEKKLYPIY